MFNAFHGLTGREGASLDATVARSLVRLFRNWRALSAQWGETAALAQGISRSAASFEDDALRKLYLGARARSRVSGRDVAQTLGAILAAFARDASKPFDDEAVLAAVVMLSGGAPPLMAPRSRTLSIGLAAAAAAAFGRQVHVLTADEGRAAEIAASWQPAFGRLALERGLIQAGKSISTRSRHYRRPVVFAAVNQIAVDHLRDALLDTSPSALRQRIDQLSGSQSRAGKRCALTMDMAIVDSIDAVLCEGGIATIALPGEAGPQTQLVLQARGLADRLRLGDDYSVAGTEVALTEAGQDRLKLLGNLVGPPWGKLTAGEKSDLTRWAIVSTTLERDRHYRVDGRQIVLADGLADATKTEGPVGLVDFIGAAEGLNGAANPLARISIRRLADNYGRISGVAAHTDAATFELWDRFGILASRPRPQARAAFRIRPMPEGASAESALTAAIRSARADGRPVLIVAAEQGAASQIATELDRERLSYAVLKGAAGDIDGELIVRALRDPGLAIVGTGRDWTSLPPCDDVAERLIVMISGLEGAPVTPGWVLSQLPAALKRNTVDIMIRTDGPLMRGQLSWLGKYVVNQCGRNAAVWWHRIAAWTLSRAIESAAAERARRRLQFDRAEDQRIAALPFAGRVSGRI